MMPPEQETSKISSSSPAAAASPNMAVAVHAKPTHPMTIAGACMEDQVINERQPTTTKSSILRKSVHPVTLMFEDVVYSVKMGATKENWFGSHKPKTTRTILNGVSGIARPGELVAMLGPSGSGKTTLLTAIGGRLPGKISGTITYNGEPFSSSIKRKTGFVTQDDVLYPHLTVFETLMYTALLRLPKTLTKEEKIDQVEMIIIELGLRRCRNNVVGGPLLRGVSGGERKRVSIGQEMLINPSLLLLDEPTSGLDSTTAQRIVATLKGLASGGRTILTTIHQPSSRLYGMFDKVILLSDGCPIYSGHAGRAMEYFGSIGFRPGLNFVNPADFLLDLANGIAPDLVQEDNPEFHSKLEHPDDQHSVKQALISAFKKNIHTPLKAEFQQYSQDSSITITTVLFHGTCKKQWSTSWWEQFKVLFKRGMKERKHESYSALRIFQVMSVAFLSGLLWWHSDVSHVQDQVGLLFFFSIFWGFFPLFNAIFAFPQERPMLMKERSSGMYRLSSYYFARMAGDLPMELVLPTIFITVTYWMGGLKPSVVTFLLTLLITLFNVMVSQGLGLALGAILMDVKQATTLASVTMLVFLLAGGYYIQHIPVFITWLKYISFSHYCYNLLVGVQYSPTEVYECGAGMRCRVMDFPAIKCLELDNLWSDVAALTVMLVGYRLIAYAALRLGQIR